MIEFTEFEGYNRNVPYFQTGFWEVNTSENFNNHITRLEEGFEISANEIERNRSDYRIRNQDDGLFPIIKNDGYNYSIANARWIELHPNNEYWGWRPDFYNGSTAERVEKREIRKKDYKTFSKQVSDNLELMKNRISKDVLPIFNYIDSVTPAEFGTKLLIEIIALSDKRDVQRGWYIGDKEINYTSSAYYKDYLSKRNVSILPPEVDNQNKIVKSKDNLSKNNQTLSDLRAWFGYQEIFKRLKTNSEFSEYLNNNQILLPDKSTFSNSELEKSKIIFAVSGQKIDEYSIAQSSGYSKSRNSYFTYDTTRRVEVRIRLVNYQNGNLIISDCCNENIEFSTSFNEVNAIKEDD
jgi:hypothetical protein